MRHFSSIPVVLIQRPQWIVFSNKIRSISHAEYTETPQYPQLPTRALTRPQQKKQDWYDKVNSLPTVEQKLVEMNMPRFYGWNSLNLNSNFPAVAGMDCVKYVTRTHIEREIPSHYYEDVEEQADSICKAISEEVKDIIVTHNGGKIYRKCDTGKIMRPMRLQSGNFIRDLTHVILGAISRSDRTIKLEVDSDPRIESAWIVGGFSPDAKLRNIRFRDKRNPVDPDEKIDHWVRCSTDPMIGIRSRDPLPDVVNRETSELAMKKDEIPIFDPLASGFFYKERRAVILPGFWPGCTRENGHLFIHSREHMLRYTYSTGNILRTITHLPTLERMIEQSLLMAAFAQAQSHAFYQGFTPMNEMSFPLVQQSASTDGQNFKFALYQLNVCNLIGNDNAHNPYSNIMWITNDLPLYGAIENDTVKDLNEDVLKTLVKMYCKKGCKREETLPYEKIGYKYMMDHEAPEELKHAFVERLRLYTTEQKFLDDKPEKFHWEKIYDGKYSMRFRERRNKFYNSTKCGKVLPSKRRLDDYDPLYIPVDLRWHRRIIRQPKVDSENLFTHSPRTIKSARLKEGDPYFGSLNQTGPRYQRAAYTKHMYIREKK